MNPLAFIGYLVFAGTGLLIYVVLWAYDGTRPVMMALHVFAGALLVLLVVWPLLRRRREGANTPSAKGDEREGTPGGSSVPSDLKGVEVVVEEWEPYPLSDRRDLPNFRVRITATNNTEHETTLETWHFAVVDRDGESYFELGWLADLPSRLLADGSTTLQSGKAAEGWLYFEVAGPSCSLHLEYAPDDLDVDEVSFPLKAKAGKP